ncbi:MAG: dTDP-4-dehydrorhamnose reductase [Caldilineaceae bacterium]|nr:dTDP-4-dehydrorhamnose reductase [Caldilineaceae bacterium]MCB0125966.1 dTDP-4-dehydrorhamnose reductase [Caldilineaceae bacterium]
MHVLILGAHGQLGRALSRLYQADPHCHLSQWARPAYDITSPAIVQAIVDARPDIVLNAAAWTQVDNAERDPAGAFAANALGPKYVAEGCARCDATLVQVSTNEVFAGQPATYYYEYDQPQPRSIYARSKLAGELAAQQQLQRLYIVRTAWLFSPGGNNFPRKIINAADRHGALRVVADECGNPCYAPDVAAAIVTLVATGHYGTYHLINEGMTSRFEFAQSILQAMGRSHIPITPIPHTEWVRPADSPLHAVLVNQAAAQLGIRLRPWREALREYITREGHDNHD